MLEDTRIVGDAPTCDMSRVDEHDRNAVILCVLVRDATRFPTDVAFLSVGVPEYMDQRALPYCMYARASILRITDAQKDHTSALRPKPFIQTPMHVYSLVPFPTASSKIRPPL